ncbi:hypothetical protein D9M69_470730 [compost metagenome]
MSPAATTTSRSPGCSWKARSTATSAPASRTMTIRGVSRIASAAGTSASAPSNVTVPTTGWPKGAAINRTSPAATSCRLPGIRGRTGTTSGCSPKSCTKAGSPRCWRNPSPATSPTTRTTSTRATATAFWPRPGTCPTDHRWPIPSRASWATRAPWSPAPRARKSIATSTAG